MSGADVPSWHADATWTELARPDVHGVDRLTEVGGVYTYQSRHDPWLTSSHYFDTDLGVVLLDTQTYRSSAEELWGCIRATTSGRLHTIVITHGHPDHYFGNEFFRAVSPGVKIVTSRRSADELRDTSEARREALREDFGDEIPERFGPGLQPDVVFEGGLTLSFGDTTLELLDYGPSEARGHVVGWLPDRRSLFCGDIAQNRIHLWLELPTLAEWYQQLSELELTGAEAVHTGHGGTTDAAILRENKRWVATCLGAMAANIAPDADPQDIRELSAEGAARVIARLRGDFPRWYDATMTGPDTWLEFALGGKALAGAPGF